MLLIGLCLMDFKGQRCRMQGTSATVAIGHTSFSKASRADRGAVLLKFLSYPTHDASVESRTTCELDAHTVVTLAVRAEPHSQRVNESFCTVKTDSSPRNKSMIHSLKKP